jgi:hypothetical protein
MPVICFRAVICFPCSTAVLKDGVNIDLKTFYMALFGTWKKRALETCEASCNRWDW